MPDIRAELHRLMLATMFDEAQRHDWDYRAVRPLVVPAVWKPGDHVVGDCSKGVQYLDRWAGNQFDPMGMGWGPFGNSQTLCLHLEHVASPGDLDVGDDVTFGWAGNEHAAKVLEKGPDPWMWSFGHQGAPNKYRLSWDRRVKQFLRIHVVEPPPTPQEKLRALTGWFSWVAWRLGEGPWRKYGQANANVRPNVPKLIPVKWWKEYALFLKNRGGGNNESGAAPRSLL